MKLTVLSGVLLVLQLQPEVRCDLMEIGLQLSPINCNARAFLIYERLMSVQLAGFKTVNTIIGDERTDNSIIEAIKCSYANQIRASYKLYSIGTYSKLVEIDRANATYGLHFNHYPHWDVFHSEANKSVITEQVLPAIAFRNPIARVILLIRGIAKYDMLQVFQVAWFRHRMLNMLIVSRVDQRTILVCVFNPYLTRPDVLDDRNMLCCRLSHVDHVAPCTADMKRFIRERLRNLHLYPLKIAITDVELMSKAIHLPDGRIRYQYLDGEIVEIMRKQMNFTAEYIQLSYQDSVGFILPNGTPGGTLDMLERNTIDLAANSRYITHQPMRNLQYVHFLCPIRLVFVVPVDYFQDRYKVVFFHNFSLQMYLVNFVLALTLPLLLLALACRPPTLAVYSNEAFRTLAILFSSSVALPSSYRARLVLMGLMFYSIVAYSGWQGVTIIRLNQDETSLRNIGSLEELAETDLQLKAIISFGNAIHAKLMNSSDVRGQLAARIELPKEVSGKSLIPQVADFRNAAVPIIQYFTEVVKSNYFDPVRKQSKVHIIPEPLVEFLTAMAAPKNSPLYKTFRQLTMDCLENGVVHYQLSKIRTKGILLRIAQNRNKTMRTEPPARTVNLFNMQLVFYAYIGLCGIQDETIV
uniref:Ionotropic glutamate receptor L-glutamate and glycine-binding domain-containing protein n=1 Tax=Anopheles atroparvus TaxID=41427 RepID=A0A182J660_ANOAO